MGQRLDPFKQEAKKYSRAGWGNVKPSAQDDGEKKPEKEIKKFQGAGDVEILISDKDHAKIE